MSGQGGLLFFLIFWIATALVALQVAKAKRCNSGAWFFASLFLGPVGVIGAMGLPDRRVHHYLRLIAEANGVEVKSLTDLDESLN